MLMKVYLTSLNLPSQWTFVSFLGCIMNGQFDVRAVLNNHVWLFKAKTFSLKLQPKSSWKTHQTSRSDSFFTGCFHRRSMATWVQRLGADFRNVLWNLSGTTSPIQMVFMLVIRVFLMADEMIWITTTTCCS